MLPVAGDWEMASGVPSEASESAKSTRAKATNGWIVLIGIVGFEGWIRGIKARDEVIDEFQLRWRSQPWNPAAGGRNGATGRFPLGQSARTRSICARKLRAAAW